MYRMKQFAAMTGMTQSKIRFYEKHGLVLSDRMENGYRVFPRGRLSLERLPRAFAVRFQHQRGHRDAGRQAGHRRVP